MHTSLPYPRTMNEMVITMSNPLLLPHNLSPRTHARMSTSSLDQVRRREYMNKIVTKARAAIQRAAHMGGDRFFVRNEYIPDAVKTEMRAAGWASDTEVSYELAPDDSLQPVHTTVFYKTAQTSVTTFQTTTR